MTKIVKCWLAIAIVSALPACKKGVQQTLMEAYFEKNILNQSFVITLAMDRGTDLTADYAGYTFVLKKGSDYYNGMLLVSKGGYQYAGTWVSNEDYGKLIISLQVPPNEFTFLAREWRFTSKNIPVLKFAPWGSSENIALTMERR